MITLPNGKICMNEQEAIQWLLDNYPIPFQCSADYAPETEIGLGTIVNPTPSKVKVGSIIFFADSKVSTVIAVNATSFKCSALYNDLVDDVVYVSNVQLNASGHLIVTLSNGTNIDAGLIKQVSSFSINASQHLIATFNDGSTNDLGAIFSGNITVSGNLTVTGGISGNAVTGNSIIENMTGYTFNKNPSLTAGITPIFVGAVKNGNKFTVAFFMSINLASAATGAEQIGTLDIPTAVGTKLIPFQYGGLGADYLDIKIALATNTGYSGIDVPFRTIKNTNQQLRFEIIRDNIVPNTEYFLRYEVTLLLSDNLAA